MTRDLRNFWILNQVDSEPMRPFRFLLLLLILTIPSSCYSTRHVVGQGATRNEVVVDHNWWIFFGLLSLDPADSADMAGKSTSYTVQHGMEFVDLLYNLVLLPTTVSRTTLRVYK